ncbi:MAG: hypothetical protein VKJ64_06075 [Leptolyngbyaceae bacterium]|nr:hypothetical protein [Leptolyngbyaceae bacterium]
MQHYKRPTAWARRYVLTFCSFSFLIEPLEGDRTLKAIAAQLF